MALPRGDLFQDSVLPDAAASWTADSFRRLLDDGLPLNVFAKDCEGRFTYANRRFCQTIGRSLEEILGKTDEDLFPLELAHKYAEDDRHVMETGAVIRQTENHRLPNGFLAHVEVVKSPLRAESGASAGVSGVFWDVTGEVRSRQAVDHIASHISCLLWYGVIDAQADGSLGWSAQVLDESAAFRCFDIPREQGQEFYDAWSASWLPEDVERLQAEIHAKIRSGESYSWEFRYRTRAGEVRWASERVQIESLGDDRWSATGVCMDCTDARLRQEQLSESEGRFRQLAASVNDVFWVYDAVAGRVEYVSPAYERIWDRSCQSVLEEPENFAAHVVPEDRHIVLAAFDRQRKGESTDEEYRIARPDGVKRWIRERAFPLTDADGTVYRIVGVADDITGRKEADTLIRRQFERLSSLRAIDIAITGSVDMQLTLSVLLDQVMLCLHVDAAAVLLCREGSSRLEFAAGRGFRGGAVQRSRVFLRSGPLAEAVLNHRRVVIPDASAVTEEFERFSILRSEGAASYAAVPLVAKGRARGVLEVYLRRPLAAGKDWYDFLEAAAGQAAIAIDSAEMFKELQRRNLELANAYDDTIEGWSRALEIRDQETEGHSERVTALALRLAHELGVDDAELPHIRRGALLHDIGKMGVPDSILLKPGPLNDEEWEIMRQHPTSAYRLLSPIPFLRQALDIPHFHHEKWDGTGYPCGLKGGQIPLAARIFAVVDVWDAIRSDRPYHKAWTDEKALMHIASLSGTHFDPEVVNAFLRLVREDSIEQETQGFSRAA